MVLLALYMLFRVFPLFMLIMVFFACVELSAQQPYWQAKTSIGSIIKHRTTIEFDTGTPTFGVDLSMYWQTKGDKPWQQQQHFPRFFLSGGYLDLGDSDILGEAWTVFGGIALNLFRKPKSALHFGYAFGFAYLNTPFDRVTNPTNTAIGSHFNNSICLHLDYEHRFFEKYLLHLGVHLQHYSNGARKLPNLGLNIPALYIALSPDRGSYDKDFFTFQQSQQESEQQRKFALGLFTQYAQVEIRLPGGPDYPVYVFGGEVLYHLNANNRISLGYQYGYNSSIAVFGLHTGDFADDAEARVGASRHSIVAGHEFLFGPWALQIKAGVYLNRGSGFLIPRPYYFQLSPRYYINSQSDSRTKFYANLQLKSHLFIAEYIAFGVGMVFQ
jgi:hypothetical protein